MAIQCNEINQNIAYLLTAFQECSVLKAEDMQLLVDLVQAVNVCATAGEAGIPTLQQVMEQGSIGIVPDDISIVSFDVENSRSLGVEMVDNSILNIYKQNEDGSAGFELDIDNPGIKVLDNADSKGMFYAADYSAANIIDPRWIPDKAWVENAIINIVFAVGQENFDYTGGAQVFTLANTPTDDVKVFVNGIKLRFPTQYTIAGDDVIITNTLDSGDWISIDYKY